MDAMMILSAKYLFLLPVTILGIYFLTRPRAEWKRMAIFAISGAL